MENEIKSYYTAQLGHVNTGGEYPPKIKITSDNGNTHWLDLNAESAQALAEWLKTNYNTK